jgi:hypothetical protein
MKCKFVIINHGVRNFEDVPKPHVHPVRKVGKFFDEFFSEKTEFIRRKGMIPKQELVQLDVIEMLLERLFKGIEDFIEFVRKFEAVSYLFSSKFCHAFIQVALATTSRVSRQNNKGCGQKQEMN